MTMESRRIRKENEQKGLFHIHMANEDFEEVFMDRQTIAFAQECQKIIETNDFSASSRLRFFKWFGRKATAAAFISKHEHMRMRIKATMMVYLSMGILAFLLSVGALIYYTRSFPAMAENGFKGILTITTVQGLSLISSSLLGLHVYGSGETPRTVLLYYNSLMFLLIGILISVNWTVPESSTRIYLSELALTAEHGKPHFSANWCCDMNGYKENCRPEANKSSDFSGTGNKTDPALRRFFDVECSRLMGWSLTEKMIKSMSYFLVPALLTISLTNSLLHFASSKRHLNPVCKKSGCMGQ